MNVVRRDDGQINDICIYVCVQAWMDEWITGWMNGWMDSCKMIDGSKYGWLYVCTVQSAASSAIQTPPPAPSGGLLLLEVI